MLKQTLAVAVIAASLAAHAQTWHVSTPWSMPSTLALPAGALAATELKCEDGLSGSHIADYSVAQLEGFAAVTKAAGLRTGVESVGWMSTEAKCADLEAKLSMAKSLSLKQSFYRNILSSDGRCEVYAEESLKLVNETGEVLMSGLAENTKRVANSVCEKVPASKRVAL